MEIIAQTSVPGTSKISTAAKRLFFSPNCIGVKEKLKIRFKINGSKTKNGISFLKNIQKTFPKETAIKMYKKVQTGPNSQLGGAQDGFTSVKYQLYAFFIFLFI